MRIRCLIQTMLLYWASSVSILLTPTPAESRTGPPPCRTAYIRRDICALLNHISDNLLWMIGLPPVSCMKYCLKNHRLACQATQSSPMDFLQVIDCQAGAIVRSPPGCDYVALSYVWGQSVPPTSSTVQPTLQNAPQVVLDSREATLQLNFRYFWVDRYCIDQSNERDKHNQIPKMDLNYANTRLTKIAAAGDDPDYGLPGVRGSVRKPQPRLKVGGLCIASTLPDPNWSLKKSKCATRGWTYQEGLLSKRRLIYTDHQVFYECGGMYCSEALLRLLDKFHVSSKKVSREGTPRRAFHRKTPGRIPWEIMEYITEFNDRAFISARCHQSYAGNLPCF
jgi:hypothetical protein